MKWDIADLSQYFFLSNTVKEQRVDDSYFGPILYPKLRCTLKAFERKYQIKIPSKQLNILLFYTLQRLNLHMVTKAIGASSAQQTYYSFPSPYHKFNSHSHLNWRLCSPCLGTRNSRSYSVLSEKLSSLLGCCASKDKKIKSINVIEKFLILKDGAQIKFEKFYKDAEKAKKITMKENKGKAGIYC